MEWIFSFCCGGKRRKYAIALLGCEKDQKYVLEYITSKDKTNKALRPFSEDLVTMNDIELVIQSLDDSQNLYEVRRLHIDLSAVAIFTVDADDENSVKTCISLLNENTVKTKDLVLVFCKSNVYGSIAVKDLREVSGTVGRGKITFIHYEGSEEKAQEGIQKGMNWICSRLGD